MKNRSADNPKGDKAQGQQLSSNNTNDKSDLRKYIRDDQMIKILEKKGVMKLFPIQYETFDLIAKGEDIIAKDRTGSGKTLAFALPIVVKMRMMGKFKGVHTPKFLIVLPTRQLALQVKDEIASLRFRDQEDFTVAAIYGGSIIKDQLEIVAKGIDIIVATPGRLIDFLNRGAIKLNDLQTICLDQADQMLKIGFKQDIQAIFEFITKARPTKIQCLFFSATIPDWIQQMSERYQSKTKKFVDMIKDSNVKTSKTVEHYCLKVSNMQKQAYIGSLTKYFLKGKSGKVIIFCETKRQVQRICNSNLIPLSCVMLHGDIKQFQREKVFRMFKNGDINCLIATNVAARGLDFPAIDLIIQMQPPNTTDAYIHRSGRTGRAGKAGICVTLYSYKQEDAMRRIEKETKIILQHINCGDLKQPNQRKQRSSEYQRSKDSYRQPRRQEHRQPREQSRYERNYESRDKYDKPEHRNRASDKQQRQTQADSSRNPKHHQKKPDQDIEY